MSMPRPKRDRKLQVMLTEKEYEALTEYSVQMQLTRSEVIRDFVRKLKTYS